MKCLSYSLFGYGKARNANSFDFNSYLRSFMISLRMNRLIYPDYQTVLHVDRSTYEPFKDLLDNCGAKIVICEDAPLCLAMLWRLKPIFEGYEIVLCRDVDSPVTWREAQCVKYFENRTTAVHAITDSVSHNICLMGGMIGFRTHEFLMRSAKSWDSLISMGRGIDYTKKGSDQDFLNRFIYPTFAQKGTESITQHYLKGYANTFLSDWHNEVPNLQLDIDAELQESNDVCGHIGAAGYYESAMFKFLRKHWDKFDDLLELEKKHPNIFYWVNE